MMENKPTCEIDKNGDKRCKLNGVYHREDGPAVIGVSGFKEWYIHGKRHRLDGPAVEFADGRKFWCVNGKEITTKIAQWAKENDIDLDNLSEDDTLLIKLIWDDYGKT